MNSLRDKTGPCYFAESGTGNRRADDMPQAVRKSQIPEKSISATEWYALVFGLFLGLAIWKFGNPAILDRVIVPPASWSDFWRDAWPLEWGNRILLVLIVSGAALAVAKMPHWPAKRWLWILPLTWFGWQLVSATQSVDKHLTAVTLWQLGGCVACYFLGAVVIGNGWKWLTTGLMMALAFCLVRAVNQRISEYPHEREFLVESQNEGWTNVQPELFLEMKRDNVVINSNGVDIANPLILQKYGEAPPTNSSKLSIMRHRLLSTKPRVSGTLVYPNALAGTVLLLWPIAIVGVLQVTRNLRGVTRWAAVGLTAMLGGAAFFFSGSKTGWLIALGMGAFWLFRLNWPARLKWVTVAVLVAGGLMAFGLRFHSYFAKGATSVGARFDYWRVAAEVAIIHPGMGSGPGTFQRPYWNMKKPESEMARLVHNDYLEQFSDSGLVAGMSYLLWVGLALWTPGRRIWKNGDWMEFAILVGLLGWFVQGFMEFSLYVPALAWTAFTLLGCLVRVGNQFDKAPAAH
jgi:O-antigen ligase